MRRILQRPDRSAAVLRTDVPEERGDPTGCRVFDGRQDVLGPDGVVTQLEQHDRVGPHAGAGGHPAGFHDHTVTLVRPLTPVPGRRQRRYSPARPAATSVE